MDRRKLGNKSSVLHKQFQSSSQLGITRISSTTSQMTKEAVSRSVSAFEASMRARKRKNSSERDSNDENDEPVVRAVTKKKRKNVIVDKDDDSSNSSSNDQELAVDIVGSLSSGSSSPKRGKKKKIGADKFAKPGSPKRKNNLDKDDDDSERGSNNFGGSYIHSRLESMDRSPSKLSQNSNSSVTSADKYRKINLRAPLSKSKAQKAPAKPLVERVKTALSQASQQKLTRDNIEKEKGKDLENSKDGSASRRTAADSINDMSMTSFSDEEMSFSDTEVAPKKVTREEKSPQKPTTSKVTKSPQKASTSKEKRGLSRISLAKPKNPPKAKTPPKNIRNRIPDSPELDSLEDLQNLERDVNDKRSKIKGQNDDGSLFTDFVNQMGITLYSGDSSHTITEDTRNIVKKMKDSFDSKLYDVENILESWNNYMDDVENLKKSLVVMIVETEEGTVVSSKAVSLTRLLLEVPHLQVEVLKNLFKKLIDAVVATDSSDDALWANQMIQQLRFLDMIVDPDCLISLIEELLSRSPEWFQRDVILFIPDIVTDSQHRITAEMLMKIMEINSDMTNNILDCMHNLNLPKEYREELRVQVLGLLEKISDKSCVPNITRFVLTVCASEAVALKSLKALRLVDMSPNSKEKPEECHTNQMFMMNAIKSNIYLFKEVAQAAVAIIKSSISEAKPLDLFLSILLYETTAARRKIVETALHNHIKENYYKTDFLDFLYTNYKIVLKSFQSTTLNLAINLLKDNSPTHVEFGIEWMRNIFISQADTPHRQREVMERLSNLLGCRDKTAKNALAVLCKMTDNESEYRFLEQHAGFLRSFLYKVDNLDFDEVAALYHLLFGLCIRSEKIYDILDGDLNMILRKQLTSSKVITKCKGVVAAVMSIKHLAGIRERSDDAFELIKMTLSILKTCVSSTALFYDQLGQIIATTENINENFLQNVSDFMEEHFVNTCCLDQNPNDHLEPKYCINNSSQQDYYVYFENGKTGACVAVYFKLLRICVLRLNKNLGSINAILGFAILLPQEMDLPEPSTADYMIHCINWFRELISGFVSEKENLYREMILKRLDSLMSLQGEFVSMVAMCDSHYQPPLCYFHHFPSPQFVRVDIKLGKKGGKRGKKSKKDKEKEKDDDNAESSHSLKQPIALPEWDNWEIGCEMTMKNPAFFRKMDAKILNLLDNNCQLITIAQTCFVVKEILGMFENQPSVSFIQEVVELLPMVCSKFKKIVAELRVDNETHEREAVRLLLCLFITLFSWKEFQNSRHSRLVREGLRSLAAMMKESNSSLRTRKELVAEAYKYFESLSDIATAEISLAIALVNMCSCLLKHSESFEKESKEKHAKMAYSFLVLEWNNEPNGPRFKSAVKELLKTWMENEPDPLKTISSVIEWLPDEIMALERPQSRLKTLPAVTRTNFHLVFKQLFCGLVKGINISLGMADTDPDRIQSWLQLAKCVDVITDICKATALNVQIIMYLRYMAILYQTLLTSGMKVLEANVKYQTEDVLGVIKVFQKTGKYLRDIFCTARKDKNISMLKLIPLMKSRREKFIFRVKGMLTANNSIEAFWMGNLLLNKDVDGEEVASETSEDMDIGSEAIDNAEDNTSVVYDSNSDSDPDETTD
ncbi:Fanconi anemia group D2 protein homolog [Copidosoma floridanum]|uniref:Fanconi anemia group D2 protein homolog n=1 Tax=Copidosoma floridanum TaxID=29053 RepID=UPI0006C9BC6D|nr:Fanconi anemia group D2 protein homolog [Copidosoma floridanum]